MGTELRIYDACCNPARFEASRIHYPYPCIESYSWTRRVAASPETDTKFHEITCSSGFDTLAAFPNVVVICTSRTGNLPVHSLPDPSGKPVRLAYLAPLTLPRLDLAQRYDILCSQVQAYMDAGVITCNDKLDDCFGAIHDREDGKKRHVTWPLRWVSSRGIIRFLVPKEQLLLTRLHRRQNSGRRKSLCRSQASREGDQRKARYCCK
ncbi:hypothetical protein CGCF413_v000155 [Colletotrichum fructicola]|nr:hypothetical protein CGCF413_v000155 [Colletotrichum fructicola]